MKRLTDWIGKCMEIGVAPRWLVLLADWLIVLCSFLCVYVLEFGIDSILAPQSYIVTLLLMLSTFGAFFLLLQTYKGVLRFSSFVDLGRTITAGILACLLLIVLQKIGQRMGWIARMDIQLIVYSCILSIALMNCLRILLKQLYEYSEVNENLKRVLIIGTHEGGVGIAKNIRSNGCREFRLKGFISDDQQIQGHLLMGEKVYAWDDSVVKVIVDNNIEQIIISPTQIDKLNQYGEWVDLIMKLGVTFLVAPPINNWEGGELKTAQLREIRIEELLPREPISIELEKISALLKDKCILVTGAAGSIGSELSRQIAAFQPATLLLLDQAETPLHELKLYFDAHYPNLAIVPLMADISNYKKMEWVFQQYRPQYVFHAAAYKHVPMMEENVSEAIWNNVNGTKNTADLALKYGVDKFVMVSTDKAVNPSNVMGCSKRLCEIYVQSLDLKLKKKGQGTKFVTTRFGNVLGSNGSVVPLFRKQIEAGGPVTVTHPDIIRFFMIIPEAVQLVLQAGCMGNGGEIFVFDMGQAVKIVDLAKRMISLSGKKNVEIKFTGLRPGEKLYEEVLSLAEPTRETDFKKIMIADTRKYDYDDIARKFDELITLCYNCPDMELVRKMKEIVPEFKSLHSQFAQLD